jgi:hypothetical protein
MDEIKYKSGEFQTFIATRSFALGAFNITVAKGAEILFDGTTADYAGTRYTFPQLRGATRAKWLVLPSEYEEGNPDYGRPVSANIKVRPPTDSGPSKPFEGLVTEEDERIVMSSKEHSDSVRKQNKLASSKVNQMNTQGGIPVRSLKTPAKSKSSLTASSAGSLIRSAENVQIEPGQGITEEDMLERMSPEDREVYLAKKSSLRARYIDADQPTPVAKVATVKTKEAEGIKLTQQVGGGIEIADMAGMGGKAKKSTVVEDGITFQNVNGPERIQPEPHPRSPRQPVMVKDGTVEARLQIARSICPEFPSNYDFAASSKKKLARLQADFEDRPDVIKAVFAAESDDIKAKLVTEFPTVFSK